MSLRVLSEDTDTRTCILLVTVGEMRHSAVTLTGLDGLLGSTPGLLVGIGVWQRERQRVGEKQWKKERNQQKRNCCQ